MHSPDFLEIMNEFNILPSFQYYISEFLTNRCIDNINKIKKYSNRIITSNERKTFIEYNLIKLLAEIEVITKLIKNKKHLEEINNNLKDIIINNEIEFDYVYKYLKIKRD